MTLLLGKPAIESLRAEMRGPVLGPADAGYEAARKVHNGMIDKRPAVIARCTGVADVMTALAFGIDQRLPVAVRGGGHNVAGKAVCDDGIVIDLSPMKGMRVDPAARVARTGGPTWGSSIARRRRSGWLPPVGRYRRRASRASPSGAASAGCSACTA